MDKAGSPPQANFLLQCCLEHKLDWDNPVPSAIHDVWYSWRSELPLLAEKQIPYCYLDKTSQITTLELHGFSDASEHAYASVIYLRMTDSLGNIQVTLITSKTKVAPIRRLTKSCVKLICWLNFFTM